VEECDDGNLEDGDGCSRGCEVEEGWTCVGGWCETGTCRPVCGDGIVIAGQEQCDDGNWWAYDGCSGSCTVECGWDCSGGMCTGICGDGMRKGAEGCDDGNTASGDGCSSACSVESGYAGGGAEECGGPGDSCEAGCGVGQRTTSSSKECDDGNLVAGDGCSASCQIECGWECAGGDANSADACFAAGCGDKTRSGEEECDDGNTEDGDGCSSSCMIEEGYSCVHYAVPPYPCGVFEDLCTPVCGDGLVKGSEVWEEGYCDDGNLESGDGCSSGCQVECGYTCGAGVGGVRRRELGGRGRMQLDV